jgi:hypothetical protein
MLMTEVVASVDRKDIYTDEGISQALRAGVVNLELISTDSKYEVMDSE